jgi:hypothetical protein
MGHNQESGKDVEKSNYRKSVMELKQLKPQEKAITLLNGTVLECYPSKHPEAKVDNEMKLDTTGKYLTIGRSKQRRVASQKNDEQKRKEVDLFLHNAFLFLQHKDRIMSDSRIFLCPVPIQNELAYTGTNGFRRPTLGVYLEWWLNCENARICNDKTEWLVYFISGSLLTGANKCGIVNKEGDTDSKSILPFSPIWSSFMKINKRYDEAKSIYQAYTMEKVVQILRRHSRQR